jgi:hypothetical protein
VRSGSFVGSAMLLVALAGMAASEDFSGRVTAEIAKGRAVLSATTPNESLKGNFTDTQTLFGDAETQLKANQPFVCLETIAYAWASTQAQALAGGGWGSAEKGIDALTKEWEKAGQAIAADRKKFPARPLAGQVAAIRALAELSLGQVQENYDASLDYGRAQGLAFGAYYIGRAQGHLRAALFFAELKGPQTRPILPLGSVAAQIAAAEKEILAAYAKPGSTTFHTNFILANSSIKLSRELETQGYHYGALMILMRAVYSFAQNNAKTPPASDIPTMQAAVAEWKKQLAASKRDHSIGEVYVQKTENALAAGAAAGEAGDAQRLRAALLLNVVLPKYWEITEGAK